MNETIIIESKAYKPGRAIIIFILCVAFAIAAIYPITLAMVESAWDTFRESHQRYEAGIISMEEHYPTVERIDQIEKLPDRWRIPCYVSTGVAVVFLLFLLYVTKMSMTVTDKRVYGRAAFGKRVDLPLDSISSVATSFFKGLSVATSSGKIKFLLLKNRDELHNEISKLLIDRQQKENDTTADKQEVPSSNADELKKFKELLDSGVITQEEFDAKKKQILGL